MPRYFFDIEDTSNVTDRDGVDLPNEDTAREYAIGIADVVIRGAMQPGSQSKSITIRDDQGKVIGKIGRDDE